MNLVHKHYLTHSGVVGSAALTGCRCRWHSHVTLTHSGVVGSTALTGCRCRWHGHVTLTHGVWRVHQCNHLNMSGGGCLWRRCCCQVTVAG